MVASKHLGKGLDLLLSAGGKVANEVREKLDTAYLDKLFARALAADDGGQTYEAYHLYRTLLDYIEARPPADEPAVGLIVSQALNNAAIILHEAGHKREAQEYLRQACATCPDNEVARENLSLTSQ